jgi:hypothetical protein
VRRPCQQEKKNIFITGVAKVLGQKSLHFSLATTCFVKIKNTYSESTLKGLSNYMLKNFYHILPLSNRHALK